MSPFAALGWSSLCYCGMSLGAALALLARENAAPDIVTLAAISAISYLLGAYGVLTRYDPDAPSLRASLGLRATHPGWLVVAAALGLCLKLPAEALRNWIERVFPTDSAQLEARAELFRIDSVLNTVAVGLVVCLVAPIVEEVFFRGALFGRLAPQSRLRAFWLTGVLFVASHGEPRDFPSLLVVATALSCVRLLSGSTLATVALHVAFNASGFVTLLVDEEAISKATEPEAQWLLTSGVALLPLLWLAWRLGRTPASQLARAEDARV
jgi:membrane protease YdiL (CAAX protease family)